MEENIKVYVKIDDSNIITQINSQIFIQDLNGWILIDEGQGDKYSHAQSNYLEKGVIGMGGKYNYKLVDNKPIELTDVEKEILFPVQKPAPTLEQQLLETQSLLASLQEQILINKGVM